MINNYDLICVFDPKTTDEKIDASLAKIENKVKTLGGTFEAVNKLGPRKMATRMRKFKTTKDGFFVHITFSSGPNVPDHVTSMVRLNEEIMRFTLTKPIKVMKLKKSKDTADTVVEINPEMLIGKPE